MTRTVLPIVALVAIAFLGPIDTVRGADYGWEFRSGYPVNLRPKVELEQRDEETLRFNGTFDTEAWTPPIYWALRISRREGRAEWSLELMHHKLYLRDGPDEIDNLSVSHGFNMLTLQYGRPLGPVQGRVGIGTVLGHPESTVRGRVYDESRGWGGRGYHLLGPVFSLAVARSVAVGSGFALRPEFRWTDAPVSAPIAQGEAEFRLDTFHFLVGVEWSTTGRKRDAPDGSP